MKPVTELYGRLEHWAATDIDDAEVFHSFQAGAAIQQLAKAAGMDTPRFLEVLDLVATLPPERLGLVRWVVGLDPHVLQSMRQWLNGMRAIAMGPWAEGCRAAADGLESALSGNEGGTCDGTGEAVKHDPCPKCTAGAAADPWSCPGCGASGSSRYELRGRCACAPSSEVGAKVAPKPEDEIRALEIRLYELRQQLYLWSLGDRPQSPPAALLREEAELSMRLHSLKSERDQAKPNPTILPAEEEKHELGPRLAEVMRQIDEYEGDDREHRAPQALLREADELAARLEAATPKPTILPAGKPPPFLRVGMVLDNPQGGRWKVVGLGEENARAAVVHEKAGLGWADVAELLTWPLAEPFTVEDES